MRPVRAAQPKRGASTTNGTVKGDAVSWTKKGADGDCLFKVNAAWARRFAQAKS